MKMRLLGILLEAHSDRRSLRAEGATLDDVRWIFRQSRIEVRTMAEIRAALAGDSR